MSMCVAYLRVWHIYVCGISTCVAYIHVWHIYMCGISTCVAYIIHWITSLNWAGLSLETQVRQVWLVPSLQTYKHRIWFLEEALHPLRPQHGYSVEW